jgi:hypothetical protein
MRKNDRRRGTKGAKSGAKAEREESKGGGMLMRMRGGFKDAASVATGQKPSSKIADIVMWIITAAVAVMAVFVLMRRFGILKKSPAAGATSDVAVHYSDAPVGPTAAPLTAAPGSGALPSAATGAPATSAGTGAGAATGAPSSASGAPASAAGSASTSAAPR